MTGGVEERGVLSLIVLEAQREKSWLSRRNHVQEVFTRGVLISLPKAIR